MLNTKNSKQLKRITTVMRQSVFIREKNKFHVKYGKLTMESHKYSYFR